MNLLLLCLAATWQCLLCQTPLRRNKKAIIQRRHMVNYVTSVIHQDPEVPEQTARSIVNVSLSPSDQIVQTIQQKSSQSERINRSPRNQQQIDTRNPQDEQSQLFNVGYSVKFSGQHREKGSDPTAIKKQLLQNAEIITGTRKQNQQVDSPESSLYEEHPASFNFNRDPKEYTMLKQSLFKQDNTAQFSSESNPQTKNHMAFKESRSQSTETNPQVRKRMEFRPSVELQATGKSPPELSANIPENENQNSFKHRYSTYRGSSLSDVNAPRQSSDNKKLSPQLATNLEENKNENYLNNYFLSYGNDSPSNTNTPDLLGRQQSYDGQESPKRLTDLLQENRNQNNNYLTYSGFSPSDINAASVLPRQESYDSRMSAPHTTMHLEETNYQNNFNNHYLPSNNSPSGNIETKLLEKQASYNNQELTSTSTINIPETKNQNMFNNPYLTYSGISPSDNNPTGLSGRQGSYENQKYPIKPTSLQENKYQNNFNNRYNSVSGNDEAKYLAMQESYDNQESPSILTINLPENKNRNNLNNQYSLYNNNNPTNIEDTKLSEEYYGNQKLPTKFTTENEHNSDLLYQAYNNNYPANSNAAKLLARQDQERPLIIPNYNTFKLQQNTLPNIKQSPVLIENLPGNSYHTSSLEIAHGGISSTQNRPKTETITKPLTLSPSRLQVDPYGSIYQRQRQILSLLNFPLNNSQSFQNPPLLVYPSNLTNNQHGYSPDQNSEQNVYQTSGGNYKRENIPQNQQPSRDFSNTNPSSNKQTEAALQYLTTLSSFQPIESPPIYLHNKENVKDYHTLFSNYNNSSEKSVKSESPNLPYSSSMFRQFTNSPSYFSENGNSNFTSASQGSFSPPRIHHKPRNLPHKNHSHRHVLHRPDHYKLRTSLRPPPLGQSNYKR